MQRQRVAGEQVTPNEIVRFELYGTLAAGGSAAAFIRIWDRGTDAYITTTLAITVYDAEGTHPGAAGDYGRAIYNRDARRWEVIGGAATRVIEIAKNGASAITARSGTTVSSGSVTIYQRSTTTIATTGVSVTVWNLSDTAVAADAYIFIGLVGDDWWVLSGSDGAALDECDAFWGSLSAATPTSADYIIGLQADCLVLFPIAECV